MGGNKVNQNAYYQFVEVRKCLTNTFDFNINISFTCLVKEEMKYSEKFIEKESSQNIQVYA